MSKELKFRTAWSVDELLADKTNIDLDISRNIVHLVDDGATIPFIARYRKDKTGNMDVDQIKDVVSKYEEIKEIHNRIQTVCKNVSKLGKMNKVLETSICMSTSIQEVETLYALHKPAPKGSYAERARALNLEQAALDVMAGKRVQLGKLVNPNKKGLESVGEVEKGVRHIMADIVAKDKEAFDKLREICYSSRDYVLTSTKGKGISQDKDKKKMLNAKQTKAAEDPDKFERYYAYSTSAKSPQPHVVLALNRGEECKALNIKVVVPKSVKFKFMEFACRKFLKNIQDSAGSQLIRSSIDDAYDRLMETTLCRQTRSDLTRYAEKQAIDVFASNVKCVLLSTPTRNQVVLGVDPGFRNGCKVAVISPLGSVLDTAVMYFHTSNSFIERKKFASLVNYHRCEIIAIGNGVACRETELIISEMITNRVFRPLDVVYCIVDECGASIYSVSDQAKKELPDLDPTLRGAVSIARRLVDPLAEFVKIEPQHLGVGMYQVGGPLISRLVMKPCIQQALKRATSDTARSLGLSEHDVSKTKLQTALDSVVEECVSFVGVDLNTCSECLLRRVSGLNATKAKKIIECREKNGAFINRHQLLDIKGLGAKGFEQCAGFVRIIHDRNKDREEIKEEIKEEVEESSEAKKGVRKRKLETKGKTTKSKRAKLDGPPKWNPLDSTAIHPESYDLTCSFLEYAGVKPEDVGTDSFISNVKRMSSSNALRSFHEKHDAPFTTVEFIANALIRPITYDLRDGLQKPLFKTGVRSLMDLKIGETLTGRINNVTHFGAFVDIGVGCNGLIYSSQIWQSGRPKTGDRVAVRVGSVEVQRKRISLSLVEVLDMEPKSFSKKFM